MPLNIAVIGNGGREHALAWKLEQSPLVFRVFIIPGNGGTQRDALRDNYRIELSEKIQNVPIQISDYESMSEWLLEHQTDFVIIGPEVPLADGIVNYLYPLGIKCFGPTAEAALIESDKCWAKFFMSRWHIPTADWETFNHADDAKYYIRSNPNHTVVKAAGLAAGKGVIVAQNVEEACQAVDDIMTSSKFGDAGQVVVIEERLDGEEISVMAFTDGKAIKTMLPVQDHKRLLNSDRGPNTGGMGAYCPYVLSDTEMKYVQEKILQKTIDALAFEDIRFVGVLYAGLMITSSGIKVLEFNCRFGDPETQVLMPLLDVDLVEIIEVGLPQTHRISNSVVRLKSQTWITFI